MSLLHIKMPSTIVPQALEPGATIACISPSALLHYVNPAVMSRATTVLSKRSYKDRDLFTPDTNIQSSITNRLTEIYSAFSDPTISVIICSIGGSTFTKLLPALITDAELHSIIRSNPKIVVCYSDITGLHCSLHALTGICTFYGRGANPELDEPSYVDYEASSLAFCVKHFFVLLRALSLLETLCGPLHFTSKIQSSLSLQSLFK